MAYQFEDGFDHYTSPATVYDIVSGTLTISSLYARFAQPAGLPTGQGIKCAPGVFSYFGKNLLTNSQTLIIKFALQLPALTTLAASTILRVQDTGTTQWSLAVTSAGGLQIIKGNSYSTIEAASGPGAITPVRWYGIECVATISGTLSTATIYVNGVAVITAIGLNLQVSANATANQVYLGDESNGYGSGIYFDDFRVWDNTGTTQNAAAGAAGNDSRIITKIASAAGAVTGFTPNGAAANWQCENTIPPPGDTTYCSAATAGTKDAYTVPSAGFTVAPLSVVARVSARKDDGAVRSVAVGVSSAGAQAVGPTMVLGSTYAFLDGCIADDPNTSALWTAGGADTAQFLQEEIA